MDGGGDGLGAQSMRALEERLGVRLLNRTTRSVSVTEAGEGLLARLGPALHEISGAVEAVDTFRQRPSGSVRINAPAPAVEFFLAPPAAAFLEAHPDVTLELISDAAHVDIVEDRFDAGVRFGQELARDMIAVPLGPPLRYVVVGSPDDLARHGTPLDPGRTAGPRVPPAALPRRQGVPVEVREGGSCRDLRAGGTARGERRAASRAGRAVAGLGLVLDDYARDALIRGDLVAVLGDWCPTIPSWFRYYPGRRPVPPAMRAFLDFVARRRRREAGSGAVPS